MSKLSILSLKDLGYTVNEATAEAYQIPSQRIGERSEYMVNDIYPTEPVHLSSSEVWFQQRKGTLFITSLAGVAMVLLGTLVVVLFKRMGNSKSKGFKRNQSNDKTDCV